MSRRIDRALLNRVGRPCLWEQAILDTVRREDGQVLLDVAEADRGYRYAEAVAMRCLFTSDSREFSHDPSGVWESGRCRMTFDPQWSIGPQDRIVWTDLDVRMSFELYASGTATDLLPPYLKEIVAVRSGATLYTALDVQPTLNADGTLASLGWNITPPAAQTVLGVVAWGRPVWIVEGASMVRAFGRNTKNQLPGQVSLKRDDVLLRGEWRG